MKNISGYAALTQFIADEANVGFVVCEANDLSVVYLNKTTRSYLGQEINALSAMRPLQDRPPFLSFSPELVEHDGFFQDICIKKTDGYFIANVSVKSLELEGKALKLIMIQDVTVQKKLQRDLNAKQSELKIAFEDLLKQNQQLKELDLAKDKFIALTTHELRTPVSAIVATADVLKLGFYSSEEELKEFIGMIHEQGNHLLNLVNDILDFAKVRAGRMDYYLERMDVHAFAVDLFNGFVNMAEGSKISLVPPQKSEEIFCYFDSVRLSQVLSNIFTNGIKYNVPKGELHLTIEDGADHVKVLIRDTGKGIASDHLEKVFNEFETLGQVSQHHKGTGLGLPISRSLIEGMGGKLLLKSEVGVGSVFWVEIPKEKVLDPSMYRARPSGTDDLAA